MDKLVRVAFLTNLSVPESVKDIKKIAGKLFRHAIEIYCQLPQQKTLFLSHSSEAVYDWDWYTAVSKAHDSIVNEMPFGIFSPDQSKLNTIAPIRIRQDNFRILISNTRFSYEWGGGGKNIKISKQIKEEQASSGQSALIIS